MASGDSSSGHVRPARRERPWLYPYNRRLRHLQGISLRNLSLSAEQNRPRGLTVDDEVVPSSFKSPAKTLTVRQQQTLTHSRSSENLRPIQELGGAQEDKGKGKAEAVEDGSPTPKPMRPIPSRMRRRSTLEWVSATPQMRQKKLEDIITARMADIFFALHVDGLEEPIYISEIMEKVMNADFRFFHLKDCGPFVTRMTDLTIKLWAKNEGMVAWQFLVEMNVNLRSLQFIGKSMATFRQPLPQNCVLFHMKDGIYTCFTDIPTADPPSMSLTVPQRPLANSQLLPTSSYDALMRLSNLDDCIQDALQTRGKLEAQINQLLTENQEAVSTVRDVAVQQNSCKKVEEAYTIETKRLAAATRKRSDLQARLAQRKEDMRKGREDIIEGTENMSTESDIVEQMKQRLVQTNEEMQGQRRRICEDLLRIYPIEPIPGKTLAFTIRGISLPNSEGHDFEVADEEGIAAALGHVALVVDRLQYYLGIPLPYPITPKGSTSTIEDSISMTSGSRIYPLFIKGSIKYRFEYGVFCLNKDIQILSNHIGLRVQDLRQTLPNLKYLLYVATAGKGETPARKAGGIRGFLKGDGGSALSSRRGSNESDGNSVADTGKQIGKQIMEPPPPHKEILANGSPSLMEQGTVKAKGMNWGYGGKNLGNSHAAFRESRLRDAS
ncbi:UV radiation resistance-associated protein [Venturia nashicola]|nr:UV radiation resistance-associated protein [Venturia nashicola]